MRIVFFVIECIGVFRYMPATWRGVGAEPCNLPHTAEVFPIFTHMEDLL